MATADTPLHPAPAGRQPVRSSQAGDGGNWSQDPSGGRVGGKNSGQGLLPQAPPPRGGTASTSGGWGVCSARCPASPRASPLRPHGRAPRGSGPRPAPHLAPGNRGPIPGAGAGLVPSPGGPAPTPSPRQPSSPGGRSGSLRPPPGAQPPPRPALTLHVVQLGPLLLQFALEALCLALQRRQGLVLVQPVGCHLRAGTRRGGKRRAGMRVSGRPRPGLRAGGSGPAQLHRRLPERGPALRR